MQLEHKGQGLTSRRKLCLAQHEQRCTKAHFIQRETWTTRGSNTLWFPMELTHLKDFQQENLLTKAPWPNTNCILVERERVCERERERWDSVGAFWRNIFQLNLQSYVPGRWFPQKLIITISVSRDIKGFSHDAVLGCSNQDFRGQITDGCSTGLYRTPRGLFVAFFSPCCIIYTTILNIFVS